MKRKIIYGAIGVVALITFSIIVWEGVRDSFFSMFPEVEVVRVDSSPTTIDGLIAERAASWLKGPEALDIAKEKVTKDVIDELSKQ